MATSNTSAEITITGLDGSTNVITTDISELRTATKLSQEIDSFSFKIINESDAYAYIEKGCAIAIETGIDGSNTNGGNTKKLDGYITDVIKTVGAKKIQPIINVRGNDGAIRLRNLMIARVFYDCEISALAKAVLDSTDYTTGKTFRVLADISADNTHIEATAYSIDEVTYNWRSLWDILTELAEAVGFEWYRDTDKKLHFFDPTA